MKKHFKYLSYVVRHKWFVLVAGLRIGASPWRLLKHDWSKFLPAEWFPYVESFYGGRKYSDRPPEVIAAFDAAWLHHQHWNDHHWQHWVLREDSGKVIALEMPVECVLEMVADWAGAGRAITGRWEVEDWYTKNRDKQVMHPETRVLVDRLVERFKNLSPQAEVKS